MSQITCTCGNTYDSGFKFCPECAAPNPAYTRNGHETENTATPVKKKFTKVGESNLSKDSSEKKQAAAYTAPTTATKIAAPKKTYTVVRQTTDTITPSQKSVPQTQEIYNDYEDDEDTLTNELIAEAHVNYDYEDDDVSDEESNSSAEEGNDNFSNYEDDYDDKDEAPAEKPSLPFKSKGKVLAAPTVRPNRNVSTDNVTKMPKTKKVSQTKSSLGKSKPEYDPNHDGYYDDRLPAILDEVTKTSHLDVILKISLSAVCIAGLITYCIFYVQV